MSKGKLIWFKVYPADLMQHFTHNLDYDVTVMGIKAVLWSCSAAENPVGTLPDDAQKWARWTGQSVRLIESKKDLITDSWSRNDDGRWKIGRIMDAALETETKSKSAAIGARKRWGRSNKVDANADANALQSECYLKAKARGKGRAKDKAKTKDRNLKNKNVRVSKPKHPGFAEFMEAWPANRRVRLDAAERAWESKKPPLDECLQALALWSPYWSRGLTKHIPHPSTWINAGGWKDSPPPDANEMPETKLTNAERTQQTFDRAYEAMEGPEQEPEHMEEIQ